MNKKGGKLVLPKASPSKSTQSSLSKYFSVSSTTSKKEDEASSSDSSQKKTVPPPTKPKTTRKRALDDDEPKQKKKRLKKSSDGDDEEDFTPDAGSDKDDDFVEEEEEEEFSPVKKNQRKAPSGKKKAVKDKEEEEEEEEEEESSAHATSSSSQDPTSTMTTSTSDDDVIKTEFKDDPKLRKEFQKKLNRAMEAKVSAKAPPDTEPPKVSKSGKKTTKYTPLEQQFMAIKELYLKFKKKKKKKTVLFCSLLYLTNNMHPDTVLVIEVGYKFRFFGEDAQVANKVLKMVCYPKNNFLNASIPVPRLMFHVRRLIHAGYKVGIVRQTETAAVKKASDSKSGPFSRSLSQLYTPATFVDDDIGDDPEEPVSNNYLMCLYETPSTLSKDNVHISVVAVSPATGDIIYDDFEDDFMRSALETRLLHLQPTELILPQNALSGATNKIMQSYVEAHSIRVNSVEDDKYAYDAALFVVNDFYENQKTASEDGDDEESPLVFILRLPRDVISCVGVLIEYLKDFNKLNQIFCLTVNFRSFSTANHMLLNGSTLTNLEILVNSSTNEEKGSLFGVMKNTATAFGRRMLKKWVTQPLVDISKIKERQDAVSEIADGEANASVVSMITLLKSLPDLERIICRIYYKRCSPAEFCSGLKSFKKIAIALPSMSKVKSSLLHNMVSTFPPLEETVDYFLESVDIKAVNEGNLVNMLVNMERFPSIAEGKAKIQKIQDQLDDHLKDIKKQLGRSVQYSHMPKLNLEYFIELTNAQAKSVPSSWIKVGHTKELARFHTSFIISKLESLALYRENLQTTCQQCWTALLDDFVEKYVHFRDAVHRLGVMDCLCSLAVLARNPTYTRPVFTEQQQLIIENGRHPVVETVLLDNYVPNSTAMTENGERCMIITGPNMGGKSSYIRQIALVIIMAQIGSYVPASTVCLSPFDAVYTRMGAQDNLEKGQSTFMVELQEASYILKQATPRSLVILDELGRGTSTHDGVAIAYATLQYLVEQLGCMSLFVTHYPLLAELENTYHKAVANYHMSFIEEKDEDDPSAPPRVTFLYKVTRGAAKNSYGLNVARIAGIPNSVLIEAAKQSDQLKENITKLAFLSAESYPKVIASKIIKLVSLANDSPTNAETLLTLQDAAKTVVQ